MGNPVPGAPAGGAAPAAAAPPPYNDKAMLQAMVQKGASDMHRKVRRSPMLRVDGHLTPLDLPPLSPLDLKSVGERIVPPKQRRELNTAAVRENIRDMTNSLTIPDLIKDGAVQYGMQSFDQSLMNWYSQKVISYESALFSSTNPSAFALRIQGIAGTSDTSWDGCSGDGQS